MTAQQIANALTDMAEIKPRFFNKDGTLTTYAFACGYIETKEKNGISATLWLEHGTWHIRQHDHNEGKRIFWASTNSLVAARKAYKHLTKD